MNSFKLWFSRNSKKIFLTALIIIFVYLFMKGLNNHLENTNKQKGSGYKENNQENEIKDNEYDFNEEEDGVDNYTINEDELKKLEKDSSEYKNIFDFVSKLLNMSYKANKDSENLFYKKDIYDTFSEDLKIQMNNNAEGVESVLGYIVQVRNISEYSIGNIYEYSKENNIGRYAVLIREKTENNEPNYYYIIVNVNYDDNNFEFDGFYSKLNTIFMNKNNGQ